MTWRQSTELALGATLIAVLLLLYMHVDYYLRHPTG